MKLKAFLCVLMCMLLVVGSFSGCEVIDVNEVLVINGEVVTGGEFNFMLDSFKAEIANEMGFDAADAEKWATVEVDNRKVIDVAKDKTIDEIVLIWVQAQKAEADGLTLTAEELSVAESNYATFVEQNYGGAAAFEEQLSKWQVSKDSVKAIFRKISLASKLMQNYIAVDSTITDITEEEIRAQYDSEVSGYVTAKHILVMYDYPAENITRTKEEAQALAQSILDRINAGEDFDALMREYSDDSEEAFDTGYTFYHNSGEMVQAFDDAAYALGVGEVSGLVEVEQGYNGYHIIKRIETDETYLPVYEDTVDYIKSVIAQERYNVIVKDTWVAGATVEKNTKILDKIK